MDLLTAIGHQIGVAVDNAGLYEEVQRKEEQRGQLLERIISVEEEERKRIARELHDDSAQTLSGLIMQLESIERNLPSELAEIKEKLAKHRVSTVQALEDIRRLIVDLRPTALDDLGLVPAIRWYAIRHLEEQGVKVAVKSSGAKFRLPIPLETALFRIVQEAVNNIARHAQCSAASISLQMQDSLVRVIIEDDGKGFDAADVLSSRGGKPRVGLLGMRERVALLRGTLSVDSHPGRGTKITIEVPLTKEEGYEQDNGAGGR
jgi:signal transduction histidine kinase